MKRDRIGVPPMTQCRVVVRVRDGWLVFTDAKDVGAPMRDMRGTAMLLRDNGTAARIVLRDGICEDSEMEIYP